MQIIIIVMHALISIHALLAESDSNQQCKHRPDREFLSTLSLRRATACLPACVVGAAISIHALLAESDPSTHQKNPSKLAFLSTLSLRRATCISSIINNVVDHFYPRSPCGERHTTNFAHNSQAIFLSTLSLRRATVCSSLVNTSSTISIHALLAESD